MSRSVVKPASPGMAVQVGIVGPSHIDGTLSDKSWKTGKNSPVLPSTCRDSMLMSATRLIKATNRRIPKRSNSTSPKPLPPVERRWPKALTPSPTPSPASAINHRRSAGTFDEENDRQTNNNRQPLRCRTRIHSTSECPGENLLNANPTLNFAALSNSWIRDQLSNDAPSNKILASQVESVSSSSCIASDKYPFSEVLCHKGSVKPCFDVTDTASRLEASNNLGDFSRANGQRDTIEIQMIELDATKSLASSDQSYLNTISNEVETEHLEISQHSPVKRSLRKQLRVQDSIEECTQCPVSDLLNLKKKKVPTATLR